VLAHGARQVGAQMARNILLDFGLNQMPNATFSHIINEGPDQGYWLFMPEPELGQAKPRLMGRIRKIGVKLNDLKIPGTEKKVCHT